MSTVVQPATHGNELPDPEDNCKPIVETVEIFRFRSVVGNRRKILAFQQFKEAIGSNGNPWLRGNVIAYGLWVRFLSAG